MQTVMGNCDARRRVIPSADALAESPPMRPKQLKAEPQDDLFRARLENLVDPRHALVRLAGLIDWRRFEAAFGALYTDGGRPGLRRALHPPGGRGSSLVLSPRQAARVAGSQTTAPATEWTRQPPLRLRAAARECTSQAHRLPRPASTSALRLTRMAEKGARGPSSQEPTIGGLCRCRCYRRSSRRRDPCTPHLADWRGETRRPPRASRNRWDRRSSP